MPFSRSEKFISFSPHSVSEEEIEAVTEALRSPWITTGPQAKSFEQEFCAAYGSPSALALNSCTAGLHLSLIVLDVGPGDEVIVPTHTFCATANVVEHVGARPVLVDVEDDTLNLDCERFEQAITPRTKAVIPVHFAGHPADLDRIFAIADKHGIQVVEDAAHPVSGTYKGVKIGSRGNLASFSFYATKNLTTGEGGMLTGSPELIDRARVIALHGMDRDSYRRYEKGGSWNYDVVTPGFKYNMPDILASIGRVQLRRLESMQVHRRRLVGIYGDRLSKLSGLRLPVARPEVTTSWHLYVVRVLPESGITRDDFCRGLEERNVGVSVHYKPLHLHSFYRDRYGYTPANFPVATAAYEEIVSLPLSAAHSEADIHYVCDAVEDVLAT